MARLFFKWSFLHNHLTVQNRDFKKSNVTLGGGGLKKAKKCHVMYYKNGPVKPNLTFEICSELKVISDQTKYQRRNKSFEGFEVKLWVEKCWNMRLTWPVVNPIKEILKKDKIYI